VDNINTFKKWLFVALVLGIGGWIAGFYVEDVARISGEFNRSILLTGILVTFLLLILSFISIVKANVKRIKKEIVISGFVAILPFTALLMNSLVFIVYFVGK